MATIPDLFEKNAEGWHQMLRLPKMPLKKWGNPMEVITPGSNPTIYRCLKSPGPQSQLASPIPVVSFWSTHRSQPRHRKTKIKSEFKIANQWICPCPCLSPAEVRTLLTKNMGMWRMWRNVWMLLENSGHRSSLFLPCDGTCLACICKCVRKSKNNNYMQKISHQIIPARDPKQCGG